VPHDGSHRQVVDVRLDDPADGGTGERLAGPEDGHRDPGGREHQITAGGDDLLEQVPHPDLAGARLPREERDHVEHGAGWLGHVRAVCAQHDGG
jgi:hypothetical protein